MKPQDGPVVVVGGAGGIGAAIAHDLGPRAVIWSRRHGVDAAEPDQVAAASARLLHERGAPWGLVQAVGDFLEAPLLTGPADQLAQMVRSNLATTFHVTRALVPAMAAAGRGRVVLFGAAGAGGDRAMTRAPVYFAVKAALVQLARSLAAEVADRGVTVNVVSPGLIHHPDSHQASQARMLSRVPAGRLGTPADVVGLVRWLLSDAADYVTGQDLTIDGGLSLRG